MQKIELLVRHDSQYMRVTVNEELWWIASNHVSYRGIVMTGITADMLHQHIDLLTFKSQNLGIAGTNIHIINVAIDSPEARAQILESVGQRQAANVSGMPDLITICHIGDILLVPKAMCITDDRYSFHRLSVSRFYFRMNLLLLQVKTFTDKPGDKIQSTFHPEYTGVDTQVVALCCPPRLSSIVIVIGCALLLMLVDIFPSVCPVETMPFADPLQPLVDICRDKNAHRVFHIPKHIVSSTSHKNATAFLGSLADGIALKLVETFLRELILIVRTLPKK